MPRYFFDIHNDVLTRDDEGTECATLDIACLHARYVLPEIVHHELRRGAEATAYTVLVRDEEDYPVYSATLSFSGLKLKPGPRGGGDEAADEAAAGNRAGGRE